MGLEEGQRRIVTTYRCREFVELIGIRDWEARGERLISSESEAVEQIEISRMRGARVKKEY